MPASDDRSVARARRGELCGMGMGMGAGLVRGRIEIRLESM